MKRTTKPSGDRPPLDLTPYRAAPDGAGSLPLPGRLALFREAFPRGAVLSELVTEDQAQGYASCRTTIRDERGQVLAIAFGAAACPGNLPAAVLKAEEQSSCRALAKAGIAMPEALADFGAGASVIEHQEEAEAPLERSQSAKPSTPRQLNRLLVEMARVGWDPQTERHYLRKTFNKAAREDLTMLEASKAIDYLTSLPPKAGG